MRGSAGVTTKQPGSRAHSINCLAHPVILSLEMGWELPQVTDSKLGLSVLNPKGLESLTTKPRVEKNFIKSTVFTQTIRRMIRLSI